MYAGDMGLILCWENPLEEEMGTHSSIHAWKIPWTEKSAGYSPWGLKEWERTEQLSTAHCYHKGNAANKKGTINDT